MMNASSTEKIQTDNRNIRVVQFLEAYERQEVLWNPNSSNYKNKSARDEAYVQITKDLNMPFLSVNDVKLKVKSIRTTYKKELRMLNKRKEEGKHQASQAKSLPVAANKRYKMSIQKQPKYHYFPKLFWFNRADSFLKNVSVSRNKCLTPKKLHSEETKPFIIDYVETTDPVELEEHAGQIDDSNDVIAQTQTCNSDINVQSPNNLGILDPRRDETELTKLCYRSSDSKYSSTLSDHPSTTAVPIASEPINRLNESLNSIMCNTLDDEYDLFCRSVAVQLRSIRDNYSRSVAKLKIQQILFEAETGHYKNTACVTIPVSQNLPTL